MYRFTSLYFEATKMEEDLKVGCARRKKIYFFGHFGSPNFGNEITFQTFLDRLRRRFPNAEIFCICTGPETLAVTQNIKTVPIRPTFDLATKLGARLPRLLRRLFIALPSELYRWLDAFKTLKGVDALIIPGTGLLTDSYGLLSWGPYNLFKWSLISKMRGCKLMFVSVGAGPLYGVLGRYFVKSALSMADFRSYRDKASMAYMESIGFMKNSGRVYPDLVFSLPEATLPHSENRGARRRVVGLGLMEYAGRYSVANPTSETYTRYLECLVTFAKWLLANNYDIRLLIGDACDTPVVKKFKSLLNGRFGNHDEQRIIDGPVLSVAHLMSQLAETEVVVGTRFHNVLLALLLDKPVIAISFHHKCDSLMSDMGLSEYCHDINHMNAGRLIEQFQDLERDADKLRPMTRQKVEESRKALDEQYNLIFKSI
jgi:polysaccharide pyruvyl transferase WcaK-like protein